MNKQALTRRGLFVLGVVVVTGRALASGGEGHEGPSTRPHHRGYKVGGGMVLLVIAAVIGSMALFGEFRRNRLSKQATPPPERPAPLPDGAEWEIHEQAAVPDTPLAHGPRHRRPRRDEASRAVADPGAEP